MKYLIEDNMSLCTEEDVERLLPSVSPERREKALKYKHLQGKWSCLKTYEMLLQLLRYKKNETPEFIYNRHGKPQINGMTDFSISHCPAALAVAAADEEEQVGIDIESVRQYKDNLANYVLAGQEYLIVNQSEKPNISFTLLWTMKEAYLKYKGTGITSELPGTLDFIPLDTLNGLLSAISRNTTDDPITATTIAEDGAGKLTFFSIYNPIKNYIMTAVSGKKKQKL